VPNRPDINGYTRRKDLEEKMMTLPSIAALVFMLPGVVLILLVCFREWDSFFLFLGALLFVTPIGVSKGFGALYRFKCPQCRRRMEALLVDLTRDDFAQSIHGFSVNGRLYTHPYEQSHGWVRIVDRVLTCDHCETYCVVYPKMERPLSREDEMLVQELAGEIPKYGYVDFGDRALHGPNEANAL
jgi:hypothetical protein